MARALGNDAAPAATPADDPSRRPVIAATPEAFAAPTGLAAALSSLPLALGLISTTIIIAGLYYGRDILVPLALAFFLGFVLDPLVVRLKRLGLSRPVATIVVVCVTLATIGGAGFLLMQQVRTLSAQLPVYQSNIHYKLRNFRDSLTGPSLFDGAVSTFDAVKKEVAGDSATKSAPNEPQRVQIQEQVASPFEKAAKWLGAMGGPLTDAGIVLVFLVVVLLDRQDLRDRLLRLLGGNLHRTTDAMDEAGERIGKYLTMQLIVNASYGVPMAVGLLIIGVPGAVLWGVVAAIMRFVPYIGPMVSAVFPLALAFAVDPGWSMLLWTLGLILLLELVSNNIVEPWLYGASTGLSAMSLMVSATFWTLLWGPVGLVMSTPLTVCLLVIGRHLPQLRFFAVLLGSQPVLDPATRVYQRLLADDIEEAIELSLDYVQHDGLTAFYERVGIPALRIACVDHDRVATAEHRLRVVSGADRLIDELCEQSPHAAPATRAQVVCIGAKWEVDSLAARMIAHGLADSGMAAGVQIIDTAAADFVASLDLAGARTICLSHFSPDPATRIRYLCRHLRRRWPDLHIVAALWNAPPDLLDGSGARSLGVDAVATSFEELMRQVRHELGEQQPGDYLPAPIPVDDIERVRALRASGAFDDAVRRDFDRAAKRAAEVFDAPVGLVTLIDDAFQHVCGASVATSAPRVGEGRPGEEFNMPRELSMCGHVVASGEPIVVADIARDPRFAGNPALALAGIRFYAGAPFRDAQNHVFGSLCILDRKPRSFSDNDLRLLQSMADELRSSLRATEPEPALAELAAREQDPPSATIAQPVQG